MTDSNRALVMFTDAFEPLCRGFGQGNMPRAVAGDFARVAVETLAALVPTQEPAEGGLRACPCCAGTNVRHAPGQFIACMNVNCGVQVEMGAPWGGPKEDGIAFLIAAWNRRPALPVEDVAVVKRERDIALRLHRDALRLAGVDVTEAYEIGRGLRPSPFESGWLIETWDSKRSEFKAEWWSLDLPGTEDGQGWTKDSTAALRFARKCDAEAYINDIGWTEAKPTEHGWGKSVPVLPTPLHGDQNRGGEQGWQPMATVPKDGSWLVFYTSKWGRASLAVRWRPEHSRFEDKNDSSTTMNDELAWTHWSYAPSLAAFSNPSEEKG